MGAAQAPARVANTELATAADEQQQPGLAVLLVDATSTGATDGNADRGSV
jgi:hypothetical protein